jgi:hypothetical protein
MCFRHGHGRDGADIHPQGFRSPCLKKDGGGKINSDKYWIEWGLEAAEGYPPDRKLLVLNYRPGGFDLARV